MKAGSIASGLIVFAGFCAGSGLAAVTPGDKVIPPENFAFRPKGTFETVVYARIESTLPGTVKRDRIEPACDLMRQVGTTALTPLFEAGADKPGRIETVRFANERLSVSFSTHRYYGCAGADKKVPAPYDLCGCTYRELVGRKINIRKRVGGQIETIRIDLDRATATRTAAPRGPERLDIEEAEKLMAALAPAKAGVETLIGMKCAVRRQDMPGGGWCEWCVTDSRDDLLHPSLRGRQLRHALYGPEGRAAPHVEDRTVEVVPDVLVDVGVFDIPEGMTLSGLPKARR